MEPGGYAWWYVDALSSDGHHGLTVIAFVGSVFSPYYALARRRGPADPANYAAINVALYGAAGHRWAMTERGARELTRSEDDFRVGPSRLAWWRDGLTIDVDEWSVPIPRRIRGQIRLTPVATVGKTFAIDGQGRHLWRPIAPLARIEVELDQPRLSWSGSGYFDHNTGTEPLERGFQRWDWSRSIDATRTSILYDALTRDGVERSLGLEIAPDGSVTSIAAPPRAVLRKTLWRIARTTRADSGSVPRITSTLEDTPFYARSLIETSIGGRHLAYFHESLDLDRFASPIVQAMLPFRMPRRAAKA